MSTSCQTVSTVFLCWWSVVLTLFFVDEFGHCCASKRSKCQIVCSLTLWLLIGVVVAPSLVTTLSLVRTLDCRRCSVLWSQRKTHCSGQPRTPSVQRCPPPLFHPTLLPPLTKRKHGFSDDLRERHSVFLDLVSGFFEEPSRISCPGTNEKDKGKHHSSHHQHLNHVIISSTPCTRPRCDVSCQWLRSDCEQSCLQRLRVMFDRAGLGGDCSTPKNLRTNLTLRVPSTITSMKWN